MPHPEPSEPRHLANLLQAASDGMHEHAWARLLEEGYTDLSASHFVVLRFLRRHPGGARINRLAEWAGITQQSAGYLVDYLERHGYLSRIPDPDDRRARIIGASERGKAATDVVLSTFVEIEAGLRSRYGDEFLGTVRRMLEEVAVPWETGPALRKPRAGEKPAARSPGR